MNEIRLKDYRCFRDEQTARLAPLTLLVGENSAGKTSFMAMIRVLWDIGYGFRSPDFKEDPYDLGSFDEIAHYRGGRGGRASTFEAGFSAELGREVSSFEFTFGRSGTAPVPVRRRFSLGSAWMEETFALDEPYSLRVGTSRGSWGLGDTGEFRVISHTVERTILRPYLFLAPMSLREDGTGFAPLADAPPISSQDLEMLGDLDHFIWSIRRQRQRPFASAPVRSKPRRTYDPSRPTPDPEGDYVPMYLADVSSGDEQTWTDLKDGLERFGKAAGLFDEISFRRLGGRAGDPFQVEVRKFGGRLKGPMRNLIDVGYGVSQSLPLITELLRPDAPDMFLLQQPEVHLHPMAQAALGSLFCRVAGTERQLVVETHSDHLMDRVRMDVRDGETDLKPEDVSILYFERNDLDVRIHSLRIDEDGDILDAPDSYRSFFMEETMRSLWRD